MNSNEPIRPYGCTAYPEDTGGWTYSHTMRDCRVARKWIGLFAVCLVATILATLLSLFVSLQCGQEDILYRGLTGRRPAHPEEGEESWTDDSGVRSASIHTGLCDGF